MVNSDGNEWPLVAARRQRQRLVGPGKLFDQIVTVVAELLMPTLMRIWAFVAGHAPQSLIAEDVLLDKHLVLFAIAQPFLPANGRTIFTAGK